MELDQLTTIDTTLRDGLQTPGLFLDKDKKLELLKSLIDCGFNEVEAGIPSMDVDERNFLREASEFNARVICWCRANLDDINEALDCETGAVHISFPVSPLLREKRYTSRDNLLSCLKPLIKSVRRQFDFVSVGAMDATRTESDFLCEFVETALINGADRVRIADTTGCALPDDVRMLGQTLGRYLHRLEWHGHNDLGMATANAYAALNSGFSAVSGTIMGIGERAGNMAWEELMAALSRKLFHLPLSLPRLKETAYRMADYLKFPIPENKPVLGKMINRHESGIHVEALLRNPASFRSAGLFDDDLEGFELVLGKYSGKSSVRLWLDRHGLDISEDKLNVILEKLKNRINKPGDRIDDNDMYEIYQEISGLQEVHR